MTEVFSSGIRKIRPKVVFQKIETRFPNENVGFKVNIPSSAIGGMTLLESSILVSFCKLFAPQRIFEFGTYLGATSLLLAENTPPATQVVTLDLDQADPNAEGAGMAPAAELKVLESGVDNDTYLKNNFLNKGAICIDRAAADIKARITRLCQDSTRLDPAAAGLEKQFDFIFIDGGHDLHTVTIDTQNAHRMARQDAIILWHDFESKIHTDVTTFLQGYSQHHPVYHVENTMLAFQLIGNFADVF